MSNPKERDTGRIRKIVIQKTEIEIKRKKLKRERETKQRNSSKGKNKRDEVTATGLEPRTT